MQQRPLGFSTRSDRDSMLATEPSPTSVVARCAALITAPREPRERRRFAKMAQALAHHDGAGLAALLGQPPTGSGGIYAELPALVLTILAIDAFAEHGWTLPEEQAVLHAIRRQVRTELMRLPLALSGSWLVPQAPRDITPAHVGALLLARKGVTVRPWMWPGIPERGPFILIGNGAADHPAVADGQCRGATDFLALVQRAGLIDDEALIADAVAG